MPLSKINNPFLSSSGSNNTSITSPAANTVAFSTATTERMRITSAGLVGIGISSPAGKLHVMKTATGGSPQNAAGNQIVMENGDSSGSADLQFLSANNGYNHIFFGDAADANIGTLLYDHNNNSMQFVTNTAESMRIDSSGNLLVGKTASNTGTVGFQFILADNKLAVGAASGASAFFNRNTDDGAVVQFARSGSVVGSVSVTASATAYNTSSDYRLKENILPMTGALAKVALLKPVTYKWKVDGSDGEGFIAHELAEVKPDCVSGDKDAIDADGNPVYQGIDTSFLVATLTSAIQELKAINDTQAETINALTARIDTQAADIAELKTKVA